MDRLGLRFGQHRRFGRRRDRRRDRRAKSALRHPCRRLPHRTRRNRPGRNDGTYPEPLRSRRSDRLDRAAKTDFPLDGIRAGNPYTVFIHEDSLNTPHLDYLVYERNASQYVVFGLHSVDSVSVTLGEKPVSVRRQKKQATIDSSLWGAIMREQMPYALAAELEEIYRSRVRSGIA